MAPDPPALSGRFIDWRLLSQGPVGATWRARARATGVEVVVKPRKSNDVARPAAQHRMRSLFALDNRHLQRLLDLVEEGPDLAVISEYVPGPSLRDRLADGPADPWQMLQVAADVLSGLGALHGAGLIHRDISPENIILAPGRGAVLIDYDAVGELTEDSTLGRTTVVGQFAGKPLYMAREQLAGAPQTAAVDLWALGAVLFEVVTARPLRRSETFAGLLAEALSPDPVPMADVPEALRPLLARLLASDAAARPDAAEAGRMVADLLAGRPAPLPGVTPGHRPGLPAPSGTRPDPAFGALLEAEFGAPAPPVPAPAPARAAQEAAAPPRAGMAMPAPVPLPAGPGPGPPTAGRRHLLTVVAGLAVAMVLAGLAVTLGMVGLPGLPHPVGTVPGATGGGPAPLPLGPLALLAGGIGLIALGPLAARRVRGRAAALETSLPFDAARAISAPDGRARLSQTIVAEIGAHRDRAGGRADGMLSITMVALAREYAEAESADERLKALSMLTDLHGRVTRQMRPWWLDYDGLVARGLSLTSLLAGAAAAVEGLRRLF